MSDEQKDTQFWALADAFIGLANDKIKDADPHTVSAGMMFAAARFNAFLLARDTASLDHLKANKEFAVKHFLERYETMLRDNVEDHITNYDAIRGAGAQQQQ